MEDRFINNDTVKAVYSEDLNNLLTRLGLYRDFSERKIKCKYCNLVISESNLFALLPEETGIAFVCDSPECTEKMMIDASGNDKDSTVVDQSAITDAKEQRQGDKNKYDKC